MAAAGRKVWAGGTIMVVLAAGLVVAATYSGGAPPAATRTVPGTVGSTAPQATPPTTGPRLAPTTTRPKTPPTTRRPTVSTTRSPAPPPPVAAAVALAGCPVPPHPPVPPPPPPWHPSVLVPDDALPPVVAPAGWRSNLRPITGTGMWIWLWSETAGGDAAAIVHQALAAHLHQLWIRVGDSQRGFYGADELSALVPVAHAAGLSVIAWGFPHLYDPVGDARWTAQILAWRSPGRQAIDGFSADLERVTEGVDLTAQRAAVYLERVRQSAGDRLVVATVYPPLDRYWLGGRYPYAAMAPYVDAFAPMIYWACTDPGADARFEVARLASLRPVHMIGQAYNMAGGGGRPISPSGAEIAEFLQAGQRAGALGGSFWVWQDATPQEWAAVSAYRW